MLAWKSTAREAEISDLGFVLLYLRPLPPLQDGPSDRGGFGDRDRGDRFGDRDRGGKGTLDKSGFQSNLAACSTMCLALSFPGRGDGEPSRADAGDWRSGGGRQATRGSCCILPGVKQSLSLTGTGSLLGNGRMAPGTETEMEAASAGKTETTTLRPTPWSQLHVSADSPRFESLYGFFAVYGSLPRSPSTTDQPPLRAQTRPEQAGKDDDWRGGRAVEEGRRGPRRRRPRFRCQALRDMS